MPFKSKKQVRFLFAKHPKMAKRWAKEMSKADWARLPRKAKKRGKK